LKKKTVVAPKLLQFAPEKSVPGLGCPAMDFESAQTHEKQAGRIETRQITVSRLLGCPKSTFKLYFPYFG
jgi:hypothetical protein